MTNVETLITRLKASALSDEDKLVAASLAGDLAGLLGQQLLGRDITAELAHVQATAANLASTTASQVAAEFRLWTTQLVAEIIGATITP
jgi:hypothetical protein